MVGSATIQITHNIELSRDMFPPRHSPGVLWNFRRSPQERQPWHFSEIERDPGEFGREQACPSANRVLRQGVGGCVPCTETRVRAADVSRRYAKPQPDGGA